MLSEKREFSFRFDKHWFIETGVSRPKERNIFDKKNKTWFPSWVHFYNFCGLDEAWGRRLLCCLTEGSLLLYVPFCCKSPLAPFSEDQEGTHINLF